MRRCILATVRDVITDHVAWLLWWTPDVQPPQKRSHFACPATSKELEQQQGLSAKEYPQKMKHGLCGHFRIGLKKQNLWRSNRGKDHCLEDIQSTNNAKILAKMAFAIMARSTEIQVNCNIATWAHWICRLCNYMSTLGLRLRPRVPYNYTHVIWLALDNSLNHLNAS